VPDAAVTWEAAAELNKALPLRSGWQNRGGGEVLGLGFFHQFQSFELDLRHGADVDA